MIPKVFYFFQLKHMEAESILTSQTKHCVEDLSQPQSFGAKALLLLLKGGVPDRLDSEHACTQIS